MKYGIEMDMTVPEMSKAQKIASLEHEMAILKPYSVIRSWAVLDERIGEIKRALTRLRAERP